MTQVHFPPPAPTAAPPPGSVHPVARADVIPLLRNYRTVLALAGALPASRSGGPEWWRAFLTAVRPRWGLHRFLVDHMRARTDQLARRFCLRLSLGEEDGNDAQDREALERFANSLPPARGPVWVALPLLAIVVVAQLLVAWAGDLDGERATFEKLAAIADLSPGNLSEAAAALTSASLAVVLDLIGVITLAVYIVLRPFVYGFRLKRMLLAQPGALDGHAAASPLAHAAKDLDVHGEESRLFAALGMAPPAESSFDLKIKGSIAAFVASGGLYLMFVGPEADFFAGGVFVVLACARGAWLGVQRWRRTVRHDALVSAHSDAG